MTSVFGSCTFGLGEKYHGFASKWFCWWFLPCWKMFFFPTWRVAWAQLLPICFDRNIRSDRPGEEEKEKPKLSCVDRPNSGAIRGRWLGVFDSYFSWKDGAFYWIVIDLERKSNFTKQYGQMYKWFSVFSAFEVWTYGGDHHEWVVRIVRSTRWRFLLRDEQICSWLGVEQ